MLLISLSLLMACGPVWLTGVLPHHQHGLVAGLQAHAMYVSRPASGAAVTEAVDVQPEFKLATPSASRSRSATTTTTGFRGDDDNNFGSGTLTSAATIPPVTTSTAGGSVESAHASSKAYCRWRDGRWYEVGRPYAFPAWGACGKCHGGYMTFWCYSATAFHYWCVCVCNSFVVGTGEAQWEFGTAERAMCP